MRDAVSDNDETKSDLLPNGYGNPITLPADTSYPVYRYLREPGEIDWEKMTWTLRWLQHRHGRPR